MNLWSKQELNILKNNYKDMPKEQLLKLLPRRSWCEIVHKNHNSYKCKRRKDWQRKAINENFFQEYNNKMAYVLGYIYADGSVGSYKVTDHTSPNKNYSHQVYNLQITSNDKSILKEISGAMDWEATILKDKRNKGNMIMTNNKPLYWSLIKKGILPRKKFNEHILVKVPKKYFWHFVRGIFDGDGSAWAYSNTKMKFKFGLNITNKSYNQLKYIQDEFTGAGIKSTLSKIKGYFKLDIWNAPGIKIAYINLYKNADIFLLRKKLKLEGILKHFNLI